MLFFQHSPLIPWHNSQGSFDMVGANYIPSTLWLVKDIKMLWFVKDIKMLWFVKDIKMLWYDWCEIHTLMRQSDWCDLHTQMQQSDRRKIHTQMRRSDRCELHTILHANIEWFFYIKKTSKTQEKPFVQNLTVVNEISTYDSGSANVMVYSSAPNMEITYWKLVIFLRVFDPFVCLPLWVNHQRPAIIDNNKAIVFSHRRTVSSALLASSFNSARRWFIHSPSANKFLHDIHSQIWLFFYVQLVMCAKEKKASLLQN